MFDLLNMVDILPPKVVKEFSVELAVPVCVIFNKIAETGEYPRQWLIEMKTTIPKVTHPQSEDYTRNIAGTPFFWQGV